MMVPVFINRKEDKCVNYKVGSIGANSLVKEWIQSFPLVETYNNKIELYPNISQNVHTSSMSFFGIYSMMYTCR